MLTHKTRRAGVAGFEHPPCSLVVYRSPDGTGEMKEGSAQLAD